jgi:hypothetical protein
MSPRTCIICGRPTGSREHIFPAALGGRRTNKRIYCGDHNEAYSGLAGIISEQLALFNALLGVVGDQADEPTSATMTDVASGQEIELESRQVRFKSPRTRSEKTADGRAVTEMYFSSQKEAEDWRASNKRKALTLRSSVRDGRRVITSGLRTSRSNSEATRRGCARSATSPKRF